MWPVHWLRKEILKEEAFEIFGGCVGLRVHELELVTGALDKRRAGLRANADPVYRWRSRSGSICLDRNREAPRVQSVDEWLVELKKRLSTRAHDESFSVIIAAPRARHRFSELIRLFETSTVRSDSDKIRIAEFANRARAIFLAATPQVASGEATEHRRSPCIRAFALQSVEDLFYCVSQCVALAA